MHKLSSFLSKMKVNISVILSVTLLLRVISCQQDFDSYKRNYGLYNNPYNFPNYDISATSFGYNVEVSQVEKLPLGMRIPLTAMTDSSLHGALNVNLIVEVAYETSERVHVKIYDRDEKQVTVPDSPLGLQRPPVRSAPSSGGGRRKSKANSEYPSGSDYEFNYTNSPFGFQIKRKSSGEMLFDTVGLPLVFEDQYLEISTHLPTEGTNTYGFGERLAPFKHTRNVTTLFARDSHDHYQNMYGAHTFYMDVRSGNGAAHGTFLLNAHGMDIITTEDRITYKAIGGILDFYFFIPPNKEPNSVVQAYTDLVGKPLMPSYWMLGYQNCRYGYPNITHVEDVVKKHREHNIPLEAQWIDIDYMDGRKDFTFDPLNFPKEKMINFSHSLHDHGQKFVVMVDPAIPVNSSYEPYLRGQELDVFIKNVDGSEYQGQVWPGYTAFPDWWHPSISTYWDKEIGDWMTLLDLDGLWIDMNEPSSFCLGSCGSLNDPKVPNLMPWKNSPEEQLRLHSLQESALSAMGHPLGETRNLLYPNYVINNGAGNLSEKTVAMTAQHHGNLSHYDVHNLYGHAEGYYTRKAMLLQNPHTRPLLISRSTFAGSGSYMGHWTGDIYSTWEDLKGSVADVLNFQMLGISYSGADICGFVGNANEELCTRWVELGSLLYGFARNHNADDSFDQEPYLWSSTTEAIRLALAVRYSILPYIYTLYEESHRLGTGVWRPLFFEYPEHIDQFANNDEQFLIGSDLLVSPVLYPDTSTVQAQIPPGIWYDWYDYSLLNSSSQNSDNNFVHTLDAPLTHIPIHIRGRSVIPTKSPKLLVKDTLETPYNLIIALDENHQAHGRLYIDDGFSIDPARKSNINFIFTGDTLTVNGQFDYPNTENIGNITILSPSPTNYSHATIGEKTYYASNEIGESLVFQIDDSVNLDKGFTMKFVVRS